MKKQLVFNYEGYKKWVLSLMEEKPCPYTPEQLEVLEKIDYAKQNKDISMLTERDWEIYDSSRSISQKEIQDMYEVKKFEINEIESMFDVDFDENGNMVGEMKVAPKSYPAIIVYMFENEEDWRLGTAEVRIMDFVYQNDFVPDFFK